MIALGLIVVLALVTVAAGRAQIKHHRRQIEKSSWLSGYLFQVLQGIIKLRVAGAEDRAFVRWADRYAEERTAIVAARRIGNHFTAFADAFVPLSLASIFAAAAYLTEARFTVGTFVAFLAAFGSLQFAFGALSRAALQVFRRATGLGARPTDPRSRARGFPAGRRSGAVERRHRDRRA